MPDPLAENHYDLNPYHYLMGNPMIYIDPFGLDTAQVYGYRKLQEQDAIARQKAEAMRNRAKLQSDYFTAIAQTGGNNMRPLTPEELIEKRKREAAQALARENKKKYDTNRDKYGKGQNKGVINSVLDITGKVNDGLGGSGSGLKYNSVNNLKLYIGKYKPSSSYGFKIFMKPLVQGSVGSGLIKKTGVLGHAVNAASVYGTYIDEGSFGTKSKEATAKALTGWAGAGAKVGATAGAMIGVGYFGVGAAPGAVIGGFVGGVLGGWGASAVAEEVYK